MAKQVRGATGRSDPVKAQPDAAAPTAKQAQALAAATSSLKDFDARIRAAQRQADRSLRGLRETVARLA